MSFSQAGISLKPDYFKDILNTKPNIGWFEIHSENYMGKGGPSLAYLREIRQHYPISCHGVSLSLGGAEDLDKSHLLRLKALVDDIDPIFVSEHLSWSRLDGTYLNDLLPLPYTDEALDIVSQHINQTQDFIGRQIFIENPSSYMAYKDSTMNEPEFLKKLIERTGCKLLLDVNNIYVSAKNNNFDPVQYLNDAPEGIVGEIHLAGHHTRQLENGHEFRIDDHGSRVCEAVWKLYKTAITKFGAVATLIEWDTDIPTLDVLLEEADKAEAILKQYRQEKSVANL